MTDEREMFNDIFQRNVIVFVKTEKIKKKRDEKQDEVKADGRRTRHFRSICTVVSVCEAPWQPGSPLHFLAGSIVCYVCWRGERMKKGGFT